MKLTDLTADHVKQALSIYCDLCWPPGCDGGPRVNLKPLQEAADRDAALAGFERGDPGDDPDSRRFSLRLGNHRYPFMKFVLQEHLVAGEFYFEVDTHDRLDVPSETPDYEQWLALKRFNRDLKLRIEKAWAAAGLPTSADLAAICGDLAKREKKAGHRGHLLLVDDDEDVCVGLALLLRARGFDVEVVHDGGAALERLGRGPRPDLVLLDYEMPQVTGQEVLDSMRRTEDLAAVPVLMATAAAIRLDQVPDVAGLLRKPYPRQVLFEMIDRLLETPHA
ncbi:Chemotaxis protein CheY [Planctomycetes bacterium Pla163]|uniref:Chemotaxis protein CheY n=1 Tax=Rohdeia mirabilis TaxID=2528008 RepID=A0A518D0Z2_9BACT|nr:Chemotaxis protein CheY [Planctomycetes bacterium Pla163]